jgi:hypothetical protein
MLDHCLRSLPSSDTIWRPRMPDGLACKYKLDYFCLPVAPVTIAEDMLVVCYEGWVVRLESCCLAMGYMDE